MLVFSYANKTPSKHSCWKLKKKKHKVKFLINRWAIEICSGATVFHWMVLNVTFRTRKKETTSIFFFCGKIKVGFMYTRNVWDAVLCVPYSGFFYHADILWKLCLAAVKMLATPTTAGHTWCRISLLCNVLQFWCCWDTSILLLWGNVACFIQEQALNCIFTGRQCDFNVLYSAGITKS